MINLGGIDFELPTMAPNPTFNYEQVYVERTMISGKLKRIYKGKRFTMSIAYGYLTDQQISNLYGLLNSQSINGFISASITTPDGNFTGNVMIDIDESQKRFTMKDGKGIWTNWVVNLTGVDLM
jgi:hypothetical protein